MPDISMCMNENCKARLACYRFSARPNPYWQTYSDYGTGKKPCKDWIRCDSRSVRKRLKTQGER